MSNLFPSYKLITYMNSKGTQSYGFESWTLFLGITFFLIASSLLLYLHFSSNCQTLKHAAKYFTYH